MVRIVTNKGVTRVTYEYDAWGNITNMTYTNKTLADANPLRYRGYYYDRETGLYYLQSRYYNPQWGRFINADGYTSTGQSILGNNMFAYCNNNAVNYQDASGKRCVHILSRLGGAGSYPKEPRDVTDEVLAALDREVEYAHSLKSQLKQASSNYHRNAAVITLHFYSIVNHQAAWDIKEKESWEATIGTYFPGNGQTIVFDGMKLTPEGLGNFTYGYLGYAYGFSLPILYGGSWYAADCPLWGSALTHEFSDWSFITEGYDYASKVCQGGL